MLKRFLAILKWDVVVMDAKTFFRMFSVLKILKLNRLPMTDLYIMKRGCVIEKEWTEVGMWMMAFIISSLSCKIVVIIDDDMTIIHDGLLHRESELLTGL